MSTGRCVGDASNMQASPKSSALCRGLEPSSGSKHNSKQVDEQGSEPYLRLPLLALSHIPGEESGELESTSEARGTHQLDV